MPWPFLRLSLRARLYLVCALLIVLLLGPAYYTLRQLADLRDIAFDLQTRHSAALIGVGRLESALTTMNRAQQRLMDPLDEARLNRARDEMMRAAGFATLVITRLDENGYEPATEARARIDSLAALAAHIDSLAVAGSFDEIAVVYEGARGLYERTHESRTALAEAVDEESTAAAREAQAITRRTARTAAAATGLAAGVAVLVALLSVSTVTTPLGRLRAAMAAVAGGRFSPPRDLPYGRTDEIGDLTRSFRSMAERLAELDRLKAEFVSIASHELKTPVNVVRGYVEMLEDGSYGALEPRQLEALEYIREQTDVLRERVDQLLALSRLEAQGLDVKTEPVRVAELLEEVRRNFAGVAAQKRIVFRVAADASAPESVVLDRRRIRDELLGNLLANAFKFTPRGGTIDFRARGDDGWLILTIRDTGQGIPAAELPYVFEKYYQAGQHAGKVGAGLGLAIAREIVEAHGGTIGVESERGIGSTFRVELPGGANAPNAIEAAERFLRSSGEEGQTSLGQRA